MASRQLSPEAHINYVQFFRPSTPLNAWLPPLRHEATQIQLPLQFFGSVIPNPQSVLTNSILSTVSTGAVWEQGNAWNNNLQIMAQNQGISMLGRNHEIASFFPRENSVLQQDVSSTSEMNHEALRDREPRNYSLKYKRPPLASRNASDQNGCIRKNSFTPYTRPRDRGSSAAPRRGGAYKDSKENNERHLKPTAANPSNKVALYVTNLDHTIDPSELKEILLTAFKEHVVVLHLSVFIQSDGNLASYVKVPTVHDAQYAISQLQRKKIGHKRILISYAHSGMSQHTQVIKSQIYYLLSSVPDKSLPYFTFQNLYESRYCTSLSLSELYRMTDVCVITDNSFTGKTIHLNPNYKFSPIPGMIENGDEADQHKMEIPYCVRHSRRQEQTSDKGWAEQETPSLPNVREKLAVFSANIQALVQSHNNFLPLASLMDCYAAEFEPLTVDENGVPLEHLVTWVPQVELRLNLGFVKYLCVAENKTQKCEKDEDDFMKYASPKLKNELSLFSRELVDLLKTQPKNNQLMFHRFIPSYHHHFGRQCRVADYGFTKLIDLFEALPHIIQVIGEGSKRIIILAHRAQIRRFTSDMLRVLKSQTNKKLNVSELNTAYENTIGRAFNPVDYGLCYLDDLLSQLSENIIIVSGTGNGKTVSIPKREQTPEEVERTQEFACEVVQLLSHTPQYTMLFRKFIPAYHHYYGYQCRVSDYGFSKLIDLFDAIPNIVKIEEDLEGERQVTLTNDKKIIVLNQQIFDLVCHYPSPGLPLSVLNITFLRQFGFTLKPKAYGCDNLQQLLQHLQASVKVVNINDEMLLVPVDHTPTRLTALRIFRVLMVIEEAKMSLTEFQQSYKKLYNEPVVSLHVLEREMKDLVKITHQGTVTVELTNLQLFARNVYKLLYIANGQISRSAFESMYIDMFKKPVDPGQYSFKSVNALLNAIQHVAVIEKGAKCVVKLNKDLESVGILLPPKAQGALAKRKSVDNFVNKSSTGATSKCKVSSEQKKSDSVEKNLTTIQNDIPQDSATALDFDSTGQNNSTLYFNSERQIGNNLSESCSPPNSEQCAFLYSPYNTLTPYSVNPFGYSTPRKKKILFSNSSEPVPPQVNVTSSNIEQDSAMGLDMDLMGQNNSTLYYNSEGQIVINLPEPSSPPDPEFCASLYSPSNTLLPFTANPFSYSTPRNKRILFSNSSELVPPQVNITNSNIEPIAEKDESADSGHITSVMDCDSSSNANNGSLSNNGKRKI